MKTVTINVTRRMIREARNDVAVCGWRSRNCPLAKALHAAGYPDAAVGPDTFLIGSANNRLSAVAIKFATAFDAGKPVKPARFRLTITT